jgi:hypothetical protein
VVATVGIVFVRHEGEIRSSVTGRPLRHPAHPCNTLPYERSLSVVTRVGAKPCFFSSLRMSFEAAALFRRLWMHIFIDFGQLCSSKPDSCFHDFGHLFSSRTAHV